MRIRLGYACICNGVKETSSSPYTYSEHLNKKNFDKLDSVIISNLKGLEKILLYNIKNNWSPISFSNGRYIRNIIEKTIRAQAMRLLMTDSYNKHELQTLRSQDLQFGE